MKKAILLIGCLSLLTVGIISVSCSKDDEWKGCKCTYWYDGESESEAITTADLADLKAATGINIKSCAELEDFWYEYEELLENEIGIDLDRVDCVDL